MTKIKTFPLFFDGFSLNYLSFNQENGKTEISQILDPKLKDNSYDAFMQMMEKNVCADVIDDILCLHFDNCLVRIYITQKKSCFCGSSKYLKSIYKYIPTKTEIIFEQKINEDIELIGDKNWDLIAKYINQVS